MQRHEIIDADFDSKAENLARWQRLARHGLPFLSIAVIAAGLIGSAFYTNSMNRADVLSLSRNYVTALNERIRTEVQAFLAPADNAVADLAATVASDPLSSEGSALFERMAMDILTRHAHLAAAYLGTPAGAFLMVRRNAEGGLDTKHIRRDGDRADSRWIRRNADGHVVATETDETDNYDPRARDWYRAARETDRVVWSRVYVFFTSKTPGITASRAVRRGNDPPVAIVGADIDLKNLSTFLETLQGQARGTLAVVDAEGGVVAFDRPGNIMLETNEGVRTRTVSELGNPTLSEAFDRLRIEGPGGEIVEIDGERHIFGAASLAGAGRDDWWLLLLAPESAYLGFVNANGRKGLFVSAGIVLLSMVLAGLLSYQGVLADRRARALRSDRVRLQGQQEIFDELSALTALSDPDSASDLHRASEIIARAEGARRISLWRFGRTERGLSCIDAFDGESLSHTSGAFIRASVCEDLFADIEDGKTIDVTNVPGDPRMSGLHLSYFGTLGVTALISFPVMQDRRVLGTIWIEDPDPGRAAAADHSPTRAIANLLAARLSRDAERQETHPKDGKREAGAATPVAAKADALPAGASAYRASLLDRRRASTDMTATGATVFPNATVLVLRFLDDQAMASETADPEDRAVFSAVVANFEQAANDREIPYVKVQTDLVVAVDGFGGDMPDAAARLVDVALAARERCAAIFLAAGKGPAFAMGMDSGVVYGATAGAQESVFNVWGEPVRVANALADTADPGTVQASEASYELLREDCVFRRRGAFYLDRVGEMDVFIVRGRL